MEVEVNIWGIIAAVVVSMVVGYIWYAKPVFGKEWMKLAKINEKQAKEGSGVAMLGMIFFAFVLAHVLATLTFIVDYFYGDDLTYLQSALMTAVLVWLGFMLYVSMTLSLFEQRGSRLTLINVGNQLATILAMAATIGVIGL